MWRARVESAKPQRHITLDCNINLFGSVVEAYEHMLKAFRKFVASMRSIFGRFQYFAMWELTERGWPHIHVLQKGSYIPKHILKRVWEDLGCGSRPRIDGVKGTKKAAFYVTKYVTKCVGDANKLTLFRRLVMHSANFFPKEEQAGLFEFTSLWWVIRVQSTVKEIRDTYLAPRGYTEGEDPSDHYIVYRPPPEIPDAEAVADWIWLDLAVGSKGWDTLTG
jgi:hypothetical protein